MEWVERNWSSRVLFLVDKDSCSRDLTSKTAVHPFSTKWRRRKKHCDIATQCYNATMLQCYSGTVVHCYSATVLHCFIASLLYLHSAKQLSLWQCQIATMWHWYNATLLQFYIGRVNGKKHCEMLHNAPALSAVMTTIFDRHSRPKTIFVWTKLW